MNYHEISKELTLLRELQKEKNKVENLLRSIVIVHNLCNKCIDELELGDVIEALNSKWLVKECSSLFEKVDYDFDFAEGRITMYIGNEEHKIRENDPILITIGTIIPEMSFMSNPNGEWQVDFHYGHYENEDENIFINGNFEEVVEGSGIELYDEWNVVFGDVERIESLLK